MSANHLDGTSWQAHGSGKGTQISYARLVVRTLVHQIHRVHVTVLLIGYATLPTPTKETVHSFSFSAKWLENGLKG
jgi:hypothetical protein